jgi:hypothetical protein
MNDWELGFTSVAYGPQVTYGSNFSEGGVDGFQSTLAPAVQEQLRRLFAVEKAQGCPAYDADARIAYYVRRHSRTVYSWWVWEDVRDLQEFGRLVEAIEDFQRPPFDAQFAQEIYRKATSRTP